MGKKKAFIDRRKAQTYHVLFRSQTDEVRLLSEGRPSEHVLVPAENLNEARRRRKEDEAAANTRQGRLDELLSGPDHVNALGLPNDGYEYLSHFKEMGGGTFLSMTGEMVQNDPRTRRVDLPEEVLPGNELPRVLEHITISESCMDEDLRAALFDDAEEFEELQDDFIVAATAEPQEGDPEMFDFEAHMARLIAASEAEMLGDDCEPRGWEDGVTYERMQRGRDDGIRDGSDDDDDIQPVLVTTEEQRFIDDQFDQTMEEYDDDNIGALDEYVDDDDMLGHIHENDVMVESVLDEYLRGQEESSQIEVVRARDVTRSGMHRKVHVLEAPSAPQGQNFEEDDGDEMASEEGTDDDLLSSQEYLKERPKLEWDCETILSTYSTLENRPTVVREPRKPRPNASGIAELSAKKQLPARIVLSKTGLPVGYLPSTNKIAKEDIISVREGSNAGTARRRDESSEEKKERKARVKAEKKQARERRKQLQKQYKEEEMQQSGRAAMAHLKQESVSVFKYS